MSSESVSFVIDLLSYAVLFAGIIGDILLLFILLKFVSSSSKSIENIVSIFSRNAVPFAFLVASVATAGSLFLSEIAGFTPCKLCWYQRIFMYPLPVILGVALLKNDAKQVFKYVLPLAVIGLGIASYHYFIQMFPTVLECSDEIASCTARQYARFGFLTIPMMSLTAFYLVTLLSYLGLKKK